MLELEHAGLSEQGPVRENNEDFIANCSPPDSSVRSSKGYLFAVADGVGGHRAGEVASREAAQFLLQDYYAKSQKPLRALREAFNATNLHVYNLSHSNPEYRRMETTLSALCLVGNQAHIGHIGDTRIYRINGSEFKQLTSDHSEVGELVRMRVISSEEARHHPRRNVITRSVGSELLMKADFFTEPVSAGDIFVLCTDGLWEPVEEQEMIEIVTAHSAAEACQLLVQRGIANGTSDNLSIQIVKVLKLDETTLESPETKNGIFRRAFKFLGNQA